MKATGLSVRSLFALAFIVVVLHALALWALQKSVLPVAVGPVPAPERLSARLLAPVQVGQATYAETSSSRIASLAPVSAVRGAQLKAPVKSAPAAEAADTNLVPASVAAQSPASVIAGVGPVSVVQPTAMAQAATFASSGTGIAVATAGTTVAQAAASTRVEPPSSSADYLHNPQPAYPPFSRKAGEQGRVVVNVLIGADGKAQKADITSSSGFERLDQAALATVKSWRYVPGKRGGTPEAMWFLVPIQFVIE